MMKRLNLVLAVLGAIVPYIFFFQFFSSEGIRVSSFISALFANGAVSGFTADLLITSLIFWIAMFQQRGKGGAKPRPVRGAEPAHRPLLCSSGILVCKGRQVGLS
jgi:hypothetical protein